jgi:ethanolamine permease
MTLKKSLGPLMIWGLGVGYVISGSYFGWNLGLPLGGPYAMLVATAIATLLYASFVLGYTELACAMPKAGGAYVYAQRAFGPGVASFVAGFAQVVEYVLAPPAIAFSIGSYVHTGWPQVPVAATAFSAYVVFTLINIWGIKQSAVFELVVTVLAVLELLVFGVLTLPHFSWDTFGKDAAPLSGSAGFFAVFAALPFALWFYLAIEGVANIAEEAKNPQRDLPRGLLLAMGTLVVLALIAFFGATGSAGWKNIVYVNGVDGPTDDSPLPLAIRHVLGPDNPFFRVLTGVGLLGLIASFHGILIVASRALMAMGDAGSLPRVLGRVHARTQTPVVALLVNFVVGGLCLLTGKTGDLILMSIFGALTMYLISTVALFILRKKEPDMERPFRTPLYPVVPAISVALTVFALLALVVSSPRVAAFYIGLVVTATIAWKVLARPAR